MACWYSPYISSSSREEEIPTPKFAGFRRGWRAEGKVFKHCFVDPEGEALSQLFSHYQSFDVSLGVSFYKALLYSFWDPESLDFADSDYYISLTMRCLPSQKHLFESTGRKGAVDSLCGNSKKNRTNKPFALLSSMVSLDPNDFKQVFSFYGAIGEYRALRDYLPRRVLAQPESNQFNSSSKELEFFSQALENNQVDVAHFVVMMFPRLAWLPYTTGDRPLLLAARRGYLQLLRNLLYSNRQEALPKSMEQEGGNDPPGQRTGYYYGNSKGTFPLDHAACGGNIRCAELLLDEKWGLSPHGCPDPTPRWGCISWTPVHRAILRRHFAFAKYLLSRGADVNFHHDYSDSYHNKSILVEIITTATAKFMPPRSRSRKLDTKDAQTKSIPFVLESVNFLFDHGFSLKRKTEQTLGSPVADICDEKGEDEHRDHDKQSTAVKHNAEEEEDLLLGIHKSALKQSIKHSDEMTELILTRGGLNINEPKTSPMLREMVQELNVEAVQRCLKFGASTKVAETHFDKNGVFEKNVPLIRLVLNNWRSITAREVAHMTKFLLESGTSSPSDFDSPIDCDDAKVGGEIKHSADDDSCTAASSLSHLSKLHSTSTHFEIILAVLMEPTPNGKHSNFTGLVKAGPYATFKGFVSCLKEFAREEAEAQVAAVSGGVVRKRDHGAQKRIKDLQESLLTSFIRRRHIIIPQQKKEEEGVNNKSSADQNAVPGDTSTTTATKVLPSTATIAPKDDEEGEPPLSPPPSSLLSIAIETKQCGPVAVLLRELHAEAYHHEYPIQQAVEVKNLPIFNLCLEYKVGEGQLGAYCRHAVAKTKKWTILHSAVSKIYNPQQKGATVFLRVLELIKEQPKFWSDASKGSSSGIQKGTDSAVTEKVASASDLPTSCDEDESYLDRDAVDADGYTALGLACKEGHTWTVLTMLTELDLWPKDHPIRVTSQDVRNAGLVSTRLRDKVMAAHHRYEPEAASKTNYYRDYY